MTNEVKNAITSAMPTPAPALQHCPHCGAGFVATNPLTPPLTPAAKLEALAEVATRFPSLFETYEALPEIGVLTADEVTDKLALTADVDTLAVCTRLKKLWKRGLVKREGPGTAHHPYRWSKS